MTGVDIDMAIQQKKQVVMTSRTEPNATKEEGSLERGRVADEIAEGKLMVECKSSGKIQNGGKSK